LAGYEIIKEAEMKTRKAVLVLLTVFCLATFFSLQANAAGPYICTVDEVGPYDTIEGVSGSQIYLTDTNTAAPGWAGSKKFLISPNRGKEFLATALTAVANGKQVKVYANPATRLTVPIVGIFIEK
jgi:hypothetical protein